MNLLHGTRRVESGMDGQVNTGLFIAGIVAGAMLVKTATGAGNVIRIPGGPPAPGQ
jgi:hypothetical protein